MEELEWTPELMLEVTLNEADDFLKVRENTIPHRGCLSQGEKIISVMSHPP